MDQTRRDSKRDLAGKTQPRGAVPADTLAARLLLARHFAGRLSQREAASKCGLSYGSWANWEDGRRPRDILDVAARISEGLGVDHDWLLFGGELTPSRGVSTNRSGLTTDEYHLPPEQPVTARSGGVPRQREPGSEHRRPVRLQTPVAA